MATTQDERKKLQLFLGGQFEDLTRKEAGVRLTRVLKKIEEAVNSNTNATLQQSTTINNIASPALDVPAFQDYVVSGLASRTPSGLSMITEAGVAVVDGVKIAVAESSFIYTANKFTVDDLQGDGRIFHTEYVSYAYIPATPVSGLRLRMVQTGASSILGVFDYRTTEALLKQLHETPFDWEMILDDLEVTNADYPTGAAVKKFTGSYRYAPGNGIVWYFSNVGLFYLAERMSLTKLKAYLDVYIANLLDDYTAQDVYSNPDYSLMVNTTTGDPDPPRPPDSHDSYASTFLMLATKYIRLSNDWAWLDTVNSRFSESNLATLLAICVNNLTTQVKTSAWCIANGFPVDAPNGHNTLLISCFQKGVRTQDSLTYDVGFPADNCENYHGLLDFGNLLSDIGDANAANILSFAANIGLAVHGLYDASTRIWVWNDTMITWTGSSFVANSATSGTAMYPDLFAGIFAELHDVPSGAGAVYDKLRWNDGWERLNLYAPSWWERHDYSSFAEMYYGYLAAKSRKDVIKAAKSLEKFAKYYLSIQVPGSSPSGVGLTGATAGYALLSEIGFATAIRDLLVTRLASESQSAYPHNDLLIRKLTSIRRVSPPSNVQPLDASSLIGCGTEVKLVAPGGADVILTSTPSIAPGANGQPLILVNTGTYKLTLQDESTLAGSTLRLGVPSLDLNQWDYVWLVWLESANKWLRITPESIANGLAYLVLGGGSQNGTDPLTVNGGNAYFGQLIRAISGAIIGGGLQHSTDVLSVNGATYLNGIVEVVSTLTLLSTLTLSALDASKPLFLNASKQAYSADFAMDGTYISGVLATDHGGTGSATVPYYTQAEVDSLIAFFATAGAPAPGTIPLAKVTPTGMDGSITVNAQGIVTGYTAPT